MNSRRNILALPETAKPAISPLAKVFYILALDIASQYPDQPRYRRKRMRHTTRVVLRVYEQIKASIDLYGQTP
jgi:hypothetical protein